MAFKLKLDQRHEFQATHGAVDVVVAVSAPATTLSSAYYNGTKLTIATTGTVTFTPVVGTYFLTLVVTPPFPPESWAVVEVDGALTQTLETEDSSTQIVNLIIVGN